MRVEDCVARVKISFEMKKIGKEGAKFGTPIAGGGGDRDTQSERGRGGRGGRVL